MDWGVIVLLVTSFGVKNEPPTYESIISRISTKYLKHFMKKIMDDFIVYNDMDTHMSKLMLCCNQNWGLQILPIITLNYLMPTIEL